MIRNRWLLLVITLGLLLGAGLAVSLSTVRASTVASFDGTIILGRPNMNSITANVVANQPSQVYLSWGETPDTYTRQSIVQDASEQKPAVIVMDGLDTNRAYYYRLSFKSAGEQDFQSTAEYTFRTPRVAGESYTFVVQADSHLKNKADRDLYAASMRTMAGFHPDLLFDLGDTFLNDQVSNPQYQDYEEIRRTSLEQRPYFDLLTRNTPLFLTIGNHEGEYGYFLDGTDRNLTIASTLARKTYYPNPEPDGFYTGNTQEEAIVGRPENYYAFTWGDALYVSIDPYRYSMSDPYNDKDGWQWTLGKEQYDWFRKTLEESKATYKFVFAHHAIGNVRGGAEVARLYEWGGYDKNGRYQFDEKRPGWGKPIQQIMHDSGVTVFFQGHDHLFAREDVDGVVYQTLPKPAERIADSQSNDKSYPYADRLLNSGFLKVNVTPDNVQVDYFRNYYVSTAPQDGNTGVVYSYTIDANHHVTVAKSANDDLSTYGNENGNLKVKRDDRVKPDSTKAQKVPSGTKGRGSTQTTQGQIGISIDGQELAVDVAPFVDANGRTQVPVRVVAEGLGCQVLWEENGQKDTVSIKKSGTVIQLKIGEKSAMVNGQLRQLDTSIVVQGGLTFVPLRLVSEILGATVQWDSKSNTVYVTSGSTAASQETDQDGTVSGGVLLGSPTDRSVTLKAITDRDVEAYVLYGNSADHLINKTAVVTYQRGDIIERTITDLEPDTQYYYSLLTRPYGTMEFALTQAGSFHTQRPPNDGFTFTVQADPHRDENSELALYRQALQNVLADKPDFHFDLGDTFMAEKLVRTEEQTEQRYLEDRALFSAIGHSVPLFLVNGNHEGENGWERLKGSDNVAWWAVQNRLRYFVNPQNGEFYSGSSPGNGNYYAFQWGDALFVTLDPFWFSQQKAQSSTDGWNYTLGKVQYDWFKSTLENSSAKYTFVFIHNLVGGYGKDARGGTEAAAFFEWGGYNTDGSYGFDQMRPGWGKPIHQLMVDNGVTAVFHGHDHFYAKQERDGIVYQLVPQPSHPGSEVRNAAEYGYQTGEFLPPAGHLRVLVSSTAVNVEYVKASIEGGKNGEIATVYTIFGK